MQLKTISAAIAIASAMLLASTAARADPLPPAAFFFDVTNQGGNGVAPGSFIYAPGSPTPGSVSSSDCTFGPCFVGTATTTGNLASVNTNTAPGSAGAANATANYSYRVNGPAGMMVPLNMIGNLSAHLTDPNSGMVGFASILTHDDINFGTFIVFANGFEACSGEPCPFQTEDVNVDTNFSVPSDTPLSFSLGAGCGGSTSDDNSCSATADPLITIDPVFLAAHPGFSLEFSSNISNTVGDAPGGVPEPAAWAMMLAGFAGIGWTLRRRRERGVVTG